MNFEKVQRTEQAENNPEKTPVKMVGDSLDSFLAEVTPEGTGPDNVKTENTKEAVEEKNHQAKEKIQPLIDKFQELEKARYAKRDYLYGEQRYAVLSGNKERYKELHDGDINDWLARCDLYEKALKEYHEAGGEGDLQEVGVMYGGSTRESVLIFERAAMGGWERQFEGSKSFLEGRDENKGRWMSSSLDVRGKNPSEYISNLESNAIADAGDVKGFLKYNPQARKEDVGYYFGKKAQGFGIEALSAGDTAVAAKSLALAEAIGEVPADVQEQMKLLYNKLNEGKKAEFVATLKREREGVKQKLERALVSA